MTSQSSRSPATASASTGDATCIPTGRAPAQNRQKTGTMKVATTKNHSNKGSPSFQ